NTGISIAGLPQMAVSKIFFDSIEIKANKGLVATQAKAIHLHDIKWIVQDQPIIQADKTAEIRVVD
ncbi:MAG TPA: hypothetical protein VKR41_01750, partial [Puia sp.]|nr:hypothetical protein [Puia sp.]